MDKRSTSNLCRSKSTSTSNASACRPNRDEIIPLPARSLLVNITPSRPLDLWL